VNKEDFKFEFDEEGYLVAPEGDNMGLRIEDEEDDVFLVELPSGNSTYLEVPGLACLLWAGASKYEFCKTIWRHPAGALDRFPVDDAELDYMYEWGLVEFAKRPMSIGIGSVCKLFTKMPSEYIGIEDKMAAFLFDSQVAQTVSEEESRQYDQAEKMADGKIRKKGGFQLGPDPN
jgi:hypothetical protein